MRLVGKAVMHGKFGKTAAPLMDLEHCPACAYFEAIAFGTDAENTRKSAADRSRIELMQFGPQGDRKVRIGAKRSGKQVGPVLVSTGKRAIICLEHLQGRKHVALCKPNDGVGISHTTDTFRQIRRRKVEDCRSSRPETIPMGSKWCMDNDMAGLR